MKRVMYTATAVLLLLLSGCSGDPETAKRRLVETGNKYFESGKYKEASILYRKAIQKDPRFGEAYYRLGLTSLRMMRISDALRAFQRAAELQPENEDAQAKLGDLFFTIYASDPKRYKNFLTEFATLSDKVLERNPNSFSGLRMKGLLALSESQAAEAVELFRKALAVKPDDSGTQLAYVQALASSGKHADAEQEARRFLEKNKTDGRLYEFLYLLYSSQRRAADAERVLAARAGNNPKNAAYIQDLALHYFRTGAPDKAMEAVRRLTGNLKDFPDAHRIAGDFFVRVGRFEQAETEFQAGLKASPDNKLVHQKKLVELKSIQGRRDEALAMSKTLVEEHPEDPEVKAIHASLRMRGGDPKELDAAIAEMQSVLAKLPQNFVLRYNLGEAYINKGDLEKARVQLQESLKLNSGYSPAKLAMARIHLAKQEYANAQALADEVLQANRNYVQAWLLRASALIGAGNSALARTELEALLQRQPDLGEAQYMLAMIAASQKRFADAEAGFRKIYSATPPDNRGLFGLVEVYMSQNRIDAAEKLLKEALPGAANPYGIRVGLANIYVRTKRYDEAIAEFKGLIEKAPKSFDLLIRLAETQRRKGDPDGAVASFQKAGELAPTNVLPLVQMAMIHEERGRRQEAVPLYKKVLTLQPSNPIALNNMAYAIAEEGGDLDQALTYAQRARQQLPASPDVADTLGYIYLKKNLSDNAIGIYRELTSKSPQNASYRYSLAMALYQKGDKAGAKRELNTALGSKPSPKDQTRIRALLERIG